MVALIDDDAVHEHDDRGDHDGDDRGVNVAYAYDHDDIRGGHGECRDRGDHDDDSAQQTQYTDGASVANANVYNGGDDHDDVHDDDVRDGDDHDGDDRDGDDRDADVPLLVAFDLFLT